MSHDVVEKTLLCEPQTWEKVLTAQQNLFLDSFEQPSRTRGLASMMMGTLNDEDRNYFSASSDESVGGEDGEHQERQESRP